MKTPESSTATCRHCRHYTPEGRRGGRCSQLSVEVQSAWKACALAIPPFMPALSRLEPIALRHRTLHLPEPAVKGGSIGEVRVEAVELPTPAMAVASHAGRTHMDVA